MRAVFSHRPVPPIRVVASKKEKKAGSACTLDIIAELSRGVRGGLLCVVLGQHGAGSSSCLLFDTRILRSAPIDELNTLEKRINGIVS